MAIYKGICRGGLWDGREWEYDEPIFRPEEFDSPDEPDAPRALMTDITVATSGEYRHNGVDKWIWHLHRTG